MSVARHQAVGFRHRETAARNPTESWSWSRSGGYAPVAVVDMDLARPYEFRPPGGGPGPIRPTAPLLALVRLRGHPLGLVEVTAERVRGDGPEDLWRRTAEAAARQLPVPPVHAPVRQSAQASAQSSARTSQRSARTPATSFPPTPAPVPPFISVIIATHDRPGTLRDCLTSLLRAEYPHYEVIVVDNAPADDAAERLVRGEYGRRVRYVRESVAGLAHAHNRGLAAARGEIAAFTDDDTLVDPGWLTAIAEGFAQDPGVGCVTGLIVPAELQTAAQAALEHHGGFAKGCAPRTWSLRNPPEDPLFPFTAGRFGSGTNMAFRVAALRALGGFDPATGTGTPAHGGDDLLAFFRVLTAGHALAYRPAAIVWHRHRRTPDALNAQAFGYGAGLGAYLTGALLHEPRMLPALLRRLPRGVRYALTQAHRKAEATADTARSRRLAHRELRGLLFGPFGYLRSRLRNRTAVGRP